MNMHICFIALGKVSFEDDFEIFFLLLKENINCDPLLELLGKRVLMRDHNILSINIEN